MKVAKREYNQDEQFGIMYQMRKKFGSYGDTDSYKLSHHCQYVTGATRMMAYIESRGGKFDKIVFFGLQLLIKEYFLQRLTHDNVDAIVEFEKMHLMNNCTDDLEIALRTIVDVYGGKPPIKIRAVPEGTVVPTKNVLVTIETTVDDPRVFTIVSYFETKILRLWSPTTISTLSWHIRQYIYEKLCMTSDAPDAEIPFKLHDFGSRGGSSEQTIAFGGAGHLVSFMGSDTTSAIMAAAIGYGAPMAAYSIPASEHSTTTSWGLENEHKLIDVMFDKFAKKEALFATVADSKDIINFLDNIVPLYKDRLIESGASWVIRPDSGDAVKMPVECVRRLEKTFGTTVNSKGYKVLNHVRVIQGDGIGFDEIKQICELLISENYSITNIAFGMGGALLQKNNRDTQKFAMKCCAIKVNGQWQDVYKDPSVYDPDTWNKIEGDKFKTSKAGRLTLTYDADTDTYETVVIGDTYPTNDVLVTVYEDGYLLEEYTFDEVRKNAGTF